MSAARDARCFLRGTHSAVLSTHSASFPGYPFGSITPFVLDHDGQPLILISTIAEHTKNIAQNRQVSLLAFDPTAQDMQAGGRLTLLGEATLCDRQDETLRARYLRYFPLAAKYFDMHDFLLHRIDVRQARHIGGFGNIHWIAGDELRCPANALAQQESGILEHMNADHVASLAACCRQMHDIEARQVVMVGLDTDGFNVRADGQLLRFSFDTPVLDAQDARAALVAMSLAALA